MALRLYIMRHGLAEEPDEQLYPDDRLRPLTPRGFKRTARVVRGMRALRIKIDGLLSSPLVRARQTAEIVARELPFDDSVMETKALAPDADPAKLFDDASLRSGIGGVLIVGHEPHLSSLISWALTGNPQGIKLVLKKAGLCLLEFDLLPPAGRGTLRFLAEPRNLIPLGRSRT